MSRRAGSGLRLAGLWGGCLASLSGGTVAGQTPPVDSVVAIVGARVISMSNDRPAVGQTVIVERGFITAVGPSGRVTVPSGARRIDAAGAYLMPGLADFHVHIAQRGDLAAYVASGVTTIGHMGGAFRRIVPWRDSIRAGHIIGPDVYAGYYVNGPTGEGGAVTAETVEQARTAVVEASTAGFDFIKVYNSLTLEQFNAIMSEARTRNLPVLGHAVRSVGLGRGFAAGQVAVAHAEEYVYADLHRQLDTTLIPDVVAFTKRHGAYVVANLSAFDVITRQWGKPAQLEAFLAQPEARFLSSYWRGRWENADYIRRTGTISAFPFLVRLTLALHRGGVPILLGTDSPSIPGMFPGASAHEDMRLLVEAGLTPYEALVAGTRTPGEFAGKHFQRTEPFGVLASGYRADLILLAANPLENPAAARAPLAVMVRGRWLDSRQLEALREESTRD